MICLVFECYRLGRVERHLSRLWPEWGMSARGLAESLRPGVSWVRALWRGKVIGTYGYGHLTRRNSTRPRIRL